MGGGATFLDLPMIHCKTSLSAITSLSSSSSSSSALNFPVSSYAAAQSFCSCPNTETCTRTASVLGKQDKRTSGSSSFEDIFGLVPSQLEVESAIAALQKFLQGISSSGSNWMLQKLDGRVKEVLYFFQTDPITKRLVASLSSDKPVWDAVMNNQIVRQLRDSLVCPATENCRIQSRNEEPDAVTCVLNWIMDITKAKVSELIQKFQLLMDEIFQSPARENPTKDNRDEVDDRVQSSLFLCIVILLIVVVARVRRA